MLLSHLFCFVEICFWSVIFECILCSLWILCHWNRLMFFSDVMDDSPAVEAVYMDY
jgi:hypothetical protein